LPPYQNTGKTLIQKVFSESDSSFTAPRPGHNILWEMGKNGQKEEALIIIPFFNLIYSVKRKKSGLKSCIFNFSFS
jgi:hypothetical protein